MFSILDQSFWLDEKWDSHSMKYILQLVHEEVLPWLLVKRHPLEMANLQCQVEHKTRITAVKC